MTTRQSTWISPAGYRRLQRELAALREQCVRVTATGDADENTAREQRERQARIQRIHDLLTNAVVGEDPVDDGIAEPGMVLTVRYDDTGDTETFLLGVPGAEHGDIAVYSNRSPLGAALAGARAGDQRSYRLPSGGEVTVTLLAAVPYAVHQTDAA